MNDVYEVLALRGKIKNFEKNQLRILITFRFGFGFIKNGAMRCVQILCHELIKGGHKLTLIFDNQRKDLAGIYDNNFDLIIVNHADHFKSLNLDLEAPIIHIVHSELYEIDKPLIGFDRIKYVAVRTEIKDYLIKEHSIGPDLIYIILNPIETKKFNSILTENDRIEINKIGGPYGLFVGAFTYIRVHAAISFSSICRDKGLRSVYAAGEFITEENLKFLKQHFDVVLNFEDNIHSFFKGAEISGGIQKGRTYWEAKLCEKLQYEWMVDSEGQIIDLLIERAAGADRELVEAVVDPSFVSNLLLDLGLN